MNSQKELSPAMHRSIGSVIEDTTFGTCVLNDRFRLFFENAVEVDLPKMNLNRSLVGEVSLSAIHQTSTGNCMMVDLNVPNNTGILKRCAHFANPRQHWSRWRAEKRTALHGRHLRGR